MAVKIPTISELTSAAINFINTELNISIPAFGKNILRANAVVSAGKLWLFYKALAMVQKNVLPDLADPESQGGTLERHGEIFLGRRPFQAVAAVYIANVTGTALATISAGTTFQSDDTSDNPEALFVLDNDYILTGTGDQITLRALDAGINSQLSIGNTLTATSPLLNVNDVVDVDSESTAPFAAETTEDYRAKVIESRQLEPQGGASSDYRIWSYDVAGVRLAFPYAVTATDNSVDIYIESTTGDGTASGALLLLVDAVIEFDPDITKPIEERGRRPLGILNVTSKSIVTKVIDIEITNLTDSSASVQSTITSAMTAYLKDVRPFIAGAQPLANKNDTISSSTLGIEIQQAIGTGNIFTSLTFDVATVTQISYLFNNGEIPVLGTITYV